MPVEHTVSALRDEWSSIDDAAYLNTAAMSAMPRVSVAAVHDSLDAKQFPHHKSDAIWFEVTDRLRHSLATLIGARAEEIALTTGASTGLQTVALGLTWQPGDEVVIARGEFPMQYATWKPMEAREGIVVKIVAPQGRFITADDLIAVMTPRTRVVSVSHVRFDDGSLLDAARVAAACHSRGALFVLDVTQSCGAVPMDVSTLGADFIVCAGYKWLLSPYGTGFLWAKREHLDVLRPGPFYWMGQDGTVFGKLNMKDPAPASSARRWDAAETASYFNHNLAAMEASARFVCRITPEAVLAHNRELIASMFDNLPAGLAPASPLNAAERGPFGCFVAETAERTAALHQKLLRESVFVSLREGRIRVSPHLFNSSRDIERLIDVVSA
jgi:selenocysteine lyase/cysteine desulfurase